MYLVCHKTYCGYNVIKLWSHFSIITPSNLFNQTPSYLFCLMKDSFTLFWSVTIVVSFVHVILFTCKIFFHYYSACSLITTCVNGQTFHVCVIPHHFMISYCSLLVFWLINHGFDRTLLLSCCIHGLSIFIAAKYFEFFGVTPIFRAYSDNPIFSRKLRFFKFWKIFFPQLLQTCNNICRRANFL